MPFAAPPKVRIGDDLTWYDTQWDETLTQAAVEGGDDPVMTVRDVQYLRWVAQVDNEVPRVFKLLAAGSAAGVTAGVIVTLAAGRYRTRAQFRFTGSPEIRELASSTVVVKP